MLLGGCLLLLLLLGWRTLARKRSRMVAIRLRCTPSGLIIT
jgi:hypothetical protein